MEIPAQTREKLLPLSEAFNTESPNPLLPPPQTHISVPPQVTETSE